MDFKKEILKLLRKHIKEDLQLETPPDLNFGDYALPCFSIARKLKKSPNDAAKQILSKLKKPMFLEDIKVLGPYLNFYVKKELFAKQVISDVLKKKKKYGNSSIGNGKTVIIDMSSPNIAKPFGIGHLRSTVIGNSVAKTLSFLGYKVITINYLGDWGTQFGKMMVAYKKWGSQIRLKKDPIAHLYDLYVRFHQEAEKNKKLEDNAREWFRKLEGGEKEAIDLWKTFKGHSLNKFNEIYKRLEIRFSLVQGESYYNDKMDKILILMKDKGILKESEGALIVDLESFNLPVALIQKADGANLYLTRDLAAAIDRKNRYKPAFLLYEVGSEQKLHFDQLKAILKLLGFKWADDILHIYHGLYKFPEGKISTRKGNIIFIEDILDKSVSLVKSIIKKKNPKLAKKEKVAEIIGTSAVIFNDLINDRVRDIDFDWNKILDFEGETGPYVQYAHVRICSILKKAGIKPKNPDYGLLKENEEKELIQKISKFNDAVADSARQYKPHIIAKYVVDLAQSFNRFYQTCQCISKDKNLTEARIALLMAVKQVIENSMDLLGIKVLEEM